MGAIQVISVGRDGTEKMKLHVLCQRAVKVCLRLLSSTEGIALTRLLTLQVSCTLAYR